MVQNMSLYLLRTISKVKVTVYFYCFITELNELNKVFFCTNLADGDWKMEFRKAN